MQNEEAQFNKRKDKEKTYIGCQLPFPFLLRWSAMCEIRGGDKRVRLAACMEGELARWEKNTSRRLLMAYDALLEAKALRNNLSVNQLKEPLKLIRNSRGRTHLEPPSEVGLLTIPEEGQ